MGSGKLLVLLLLFPACGGMPDDLVPSNRDERPAVICGITGPDVCQTAPDFTLSDTLNNAVTLSGVLATPGLRGTVLYFTMWCPVCDVHMSALRSSIAPLHPDMRFFLVDYVSGTVTGARNAELSSGYAGSGLTVLADTDRLVLGSFHATMGTTVVIDAAGTVRLNEDFKDGSRLRAVLEGLP